MTVMYFGGDDNRDFYGGPGDLFQGELDLLVTSVYAATLTGIESWKVSKAAKWSEEEVQEQAWWKEQIPMLRCHAGNMGLVSLITMFDYWLIEFEQSAQKIKAFPEDWLDCGLMKRFKRIQEELLRKTNVKGSLSLDRLQDAVHARDSIIHHAAAVKYVDRKKNTITVKDEFLGEVGDRAIRLQVCVNGAVLSQFSNEIKQQAALWFSQMGARKTWKP